MATFTGGETIVNTTSTNHSGAGTAYTVPAGRYARVFIKSLSINNGVTADIAGATYSNSSGSTQIIWNIGAFNTAAGLSS